MSFTRRNLFRMRQFDETYRDEPHFSPLVRELSMYKAFCRRTLLTALVRR